MDRRITIVLVVILLALGGYIWYTFVRADAPPVNPPTPQATAIPFATLAETDVTAIEVRDVKNNKATRVVRNGTAWKMEQPAQGEAFIDRVEEFLLDVTRISAPRTVNNPGELAAYGLNPPVYTVDLTLKDGTTTRFELGNPNPDKSYNYIRKANEPTIYLIDTTVADTIRGFVSEPPFTPTPEPTSTPTPPAGTAAPGTPAVTSTP